MPPANLTDRRLIYVFSFFLLCSLVCRLLLINWYSAPYSDGVFLMTLFEKYNTNNSYPPLYSALLYSVNGLFNNPIISGRLVSILSGAGTIWGIFYFGRKFFDTRLGLFAALLYGTAPETFRWDIRVMTDSLFTLLFLGALYFLYRELNRQGRYNFFLFNIFAALSALTRYQGLVFWPLALIWLYVILKQNKFSGHWPEVFLSGLTWLPLPLWIIYRGFEHAAHYEQFLTQAGSFWLTAGRLIMMLDMFIPAIIYSLGYLAAILLAYGLYRYRKDQPKVSRWFLWLLGYLFFAFWVAHAAFLVAFQTRYFLPFWPVAALFTAIGLGQLAEKYPRVAYSLLGIILAANVFWAGLVLYFQKDAFGSLKRSAEFVAKNLPQETIITAEDYKFTYFAGRFEKGQPFEKRYRVYPAGKTSPPPGCYVYINSLYTANFQDYLGKNKNNLVYFDEERIMPILPDLAGEVQYVNSPKWYAVRFVPQVIYSAIIKVP